MSITVCVATYRRPQLLSGLIELLSPQLEENDAELLVVDNDPARSAEATVRYAIGRGVAVRYEVETKPGTPAARNRALDAAADSDLFAFTDDDVRPVPNWLAALVSTQAATGADVVTGPVRYVFPSGEPGWASGAHCFVERAPSAPDPAAWPVTTNALMRTDFVRRSGVRFNEAYGLGVGEDTEFFRKLGLAGGTVAWAPAAIVEELVDADRATVRWALRRSYLVGSTSALIDRGLDPSTRGKWAAAAARWLWWGTRGVGAGVVRRDPAGLVRGLSSVSRAAGILNGIVGRQEHFTRRG